MATVRLVQAAAAAVEGQEEQRQEYQGSFEGMKEGEVDSEFVDVLFRSFNEKAKADETLTEEQASSMRFVLVGDRPPSSFLTPTPAQNIAGRLIILADDLERQLEEDEVLRAENERVIAGCVKRTGGNGEGVGGCEEVDFSGAKSHLKDVFSHLLPVEEVRNSTPDKLFIRLAVGLAYTYNICKNIVKSVLGRFLPASVVSVICHVASYFMQHLVAVGFQQVINNFGGWAKMAGTVALHSFIQRAVDHATSGGGSYKYVFASIAVVGVGVAALAGGVATYLHLKES